MNSVAVIQKLADEQNERLRQLVDFKDDWRQAGELKLCECSGCTCKKKSKNTYDFWPQLGSNRREK